jgi:hypothetical protein
MGTVLLWICALGLGFIAIVCGAVASDEQRDHRHRQASSWYWLALGSMLLALLCASAA